MYRGKVAEPRSMQRGGSGTKEYTEGRKRNQGVYRGEKAEPWSIQRGGSGTKEKRKMKLTNKY